MAATTDPTQGAVAPGRPAHGDPGHEADPDHAPLRWSVEPATARRPWLAPVGIGIGVAVATAYTAWQDPNADGVFPACPFKALTGWDCPGCGGLRATHALTQGDLASALDHNLVITLLVPVAVVLWGAWLLRSLGVRLPSVPTPGRAGWWALGAAVLAFTVLRNVGGPDALAYLSSTA